MSDEQEKKWMKLLSKAWADPALMQRLRTQPEQILKEYGIQTAPGVSYRVLENTPQQRYIVLPPKPSDMSEENLRRIAAGVVIPHRLS